MTTKTYTVESVSRALDHHEISGALHAWSMRDGRKPFHVVYDSMQDGLDLDLHGAHALVVGLACGVEHTVRKSWHDVDNLIGVEPIGGGRSRVEISTLAGKCRTIYTGLDEACVAMRDSFVCVLRTWGGWR